MKTKVEVTLEEFDFLTLVYNIDRARFGDSSEGRTWCVFCTAQNYLCAEDNISMQYRVYEHTKYRDVEWEIIEGS